MGFLTRRATLCAAFLGVLCLCLLGYSLPERAFAKSPAANGSPALHDDGPKIVGDLTSAAGRTWSSYTRLGLSESSDYIPLSCWAEQIRDLNPLYVYNHFNNLVVVTKREGFEEEGLYISNPVSSYVLFQGADGFRTTDSDIKGALRFTRTRADNAKIHAYKNPEGGSALRLPPYRPASSDAATSQTVEDLASSALSTWMKWVESGSAKSSAPYIPRSCWDERIRKMNPLYVYQHRVHIVVVTKREGQTEHGLYILNSLSSYAVAKGTESDGFQFTEAEGRHAWRFTRTLPSSAAMPSMK